MATKRYNWRKENKANLKMLVEERDFSVLIKDEEGNGQVHFYDSKYIVQISLNWFDIF